MGEGGGGLGEKLRERGLDACRVLRGVAPGAAVDVALKLLVSTLALVRLRKKACLHDKY